MYREVYVHRRDFYRLDPEHIRATDCRAHWNTVNEAREQAREDDRRFGRYIAASLGCVSRDGQGQCREYDCSCCFCSFTTTACLWPWSFRWSSEPTTHHQHHHQYNAETQSGSKYTAYPLSFPDENDDSSLLNHDYEVEVLRYRGTNNKGN